MKRLRLFSGGRPASNDDFDALQLQIDTLSAIYIAGGAFVVSGCQVTASGGNWNISAGIVMLNGRLCSYAGASNLAAPAPGAGAYYFGEQAVNANPRPYDLAGNNQNAMRDHWAVLMQFDASQQGNGLGSGDHLKIVLGTSEQPTRRLPDAYETALHAPGEIKMLAVGGQVLASGRGTGSGGLRAGWRLTDGTNATVDARNRFPVAADGQYVVGDIGGEASVQLTAAQSGLPTHNHEVLQGNGTGTGVAANNTFNNTGTEQTTLVGGQNALQAHENRPPYFAMRFFQFVGTQDYIITQ